MKDWGSRSERVLATARVIAAPAVACGMGAVWSVGRTDTMLFNLFELRGQEEEEEERGWKRLVQMG